MNNHDLPKTDSISELAAFWDSHDLTDFEDQLEDVPDRVFTRATKRYSFTLVLNAEPGEAQLEGRIMMQMQVNDVVGVSEEAGVLHIQFHREAATLVDAIRSAIDDACKAGLDIMRVEITPDAVSEAS